MSIKSGSRFSTTQRSQVSRTSLTKIPKTEPGFRGAASSVMSLLWPRRGSAAFRIGKGGFKVPRYQNSYRLASYNPFKHEKVDKILAEIMNRTLEGMKYNPTVCLKLCQDMSAEVRSRIYKTDFDRYKYVVIISIFEKTGQGINVATGRLWDVERDTYSTYRFENSQLIAMGVVFGTYYE